MGLSFSDLIWIVLLLSLLQPALQRYDERSLEP
jgi:hypothetical protein